MSDEKALLSAIWEHPHEDTPRLVYADWLQENGQPERAEFIRVQIDASLRSARDPMALKGAQRARELLDAHKEAWTTHFAWVLDGKSPHLWHPHPNVRSPNLRVSVTEDTEGSFRTPRIDFMRGFVFRICTPIDVLLKQSVDSLVVPEPRPSVKVARQQSDTVSELPALLPDLCDRLTFQNFTDWEFTGFFGFPEEWVVALTQETRLLVGQISVEPPDLANPQALTAFFSAAPRLEELNLNSFFPTAPRNAVLGIMAAAVQSGLSHRLKNLSVWNLYDEDELTVRTFFTALAANDWPRLEKLTLVGRDPPQLMDLTGNPFPRLRELRLYTGCNTTAAEWLHILDSPAFRNVLIFRLQDSVSDRPDFTALREHFGDRLQID
ncbi:MAG: TIGR02996 domain-containing protein [Planctomycetes bacterium]|nr:TIGR02996 domain-containing protein [Planctomycetota bacterium]